MMEWTKLTSTHPRQCVLGKRSGVDLGGGGGGGGGRFPFQPQEFDPLPNQRVPPLYYFEKYIFGDGT